MLPACMPLIMAQEDLPVIADTVLPCDRWYIDVLDQTYCYNARKRSLSKYMKNGVLMARTSVVEIKEPFTIDISDPFKVLIHCLHTGETFVFDESLGLLQIDVQENISSSYAVCRYNTFSKVEYIDQRLVLKDWSNRLERKSQEIFLHEFQLENYPIQLVSNSRQLAMLVPGTGLFLFDDFLTLEHEILDPDITQVIWVDDNLYFQKHQSIYRWPVGKGFAEKIVSGACPHFSVNHHRLICGSRPSWRIYDISRRNK